MCFLFSLCVLIARHKSSGNNNFSFFNHFLADGAAWSAIRKVGLSVRHRWYDLDLWEQFAGETESEQA